MLEARKDLWTVVLALAALVVCFAPAVDAGDKLVVQVQEPFEVAGHLFPAGRLTIRTVQDFNPVAQLHEVQVDGHSLGLLVAERDAKFIAPRDEMTFERSADGHLVLVAVGLKGETTRTFID